MATYTHIGERIRAERERKEISRAALAKAAGIAVTTLSDLEIGRSQSTTRLHAIAERLGVTPSWLETGTGPKTYATNDHTATYIATAEPVTVSTGETAPGYIRLPLYAAEVSAGEGAMLDEAAVEVVQFLDIAKWWAAQHLPRDLSRIRVLTVRGDSMAPDMQNGDLLFVDVSVRHFEDAGLYVLHWNGLALVKRLAPELRSGRLAIASSNPAYPTEYIESSELDALHIGGRVAAWWSLRKF